MERIVETKGKRFLLRVEDSNELNDYAKYEELRKAIWEWPPDSLAGPRNMLCENYFHDGSSLFIGVFAESEGGGFDRSTLVGFAYGFVGVKDRQVGFRALDNLQFYSQYTGVKKGYERYGLGIPIKEFQRDSLIDLFGIYTITCTFDPLTGVNAYRNVHHFGMDVLRYDVAIYSEFGGRFNRIDLPTDRLTMSWDLRKSIDRPDYDLNLLFDQGRAVTRVETARVAGKRATFELSVIREVNLDLEEGTLLLEIPFDFYEMLRVTDVADEETRKIPNHWRMKTREAFLALFDRGYRVIDFQPLEVGGRKRDFYVLERRGG